MGVRVTSRISGTITCPNCGHEIDVANPSTQRNNQPTRSKKNKIWWNWVGWSIVIATIASFIIGHLLK